MRGNLHDLGYDDIFLETTPKAWWNNEMNNEIMDKFDLAKIKNFYSARDSVWGNRRQATDWEKIFAKDTSDKWQLPKNLYKSIKRERNLLKLSNKITTNLIKNEPTNLTDTSSKKI